MRKAGAQHKCRDRPAGSTEIGPAIYRDATSSDNSMSAPIFLLDMRMICTLDMRMICQVSAPSMAHPPDGGNRSHDQGLIGDQEAR